MYQRLFALRAYHSAFDHGHCKSLVIAPRRRHTSGERALARHRMLTRPYPRGLQVLAPIAMDSTGRARLRLPPSRLTLGFELRSNGPDFATNTDLGDWSGLDFPYYRNAEGAEQVGHNEDDQPADGPTAPLADQAVPLPLAGNPPEPSLPGAIAALEISGIQEAWLSTPPTFSLDFEGRALPWIYYLLNRRSSRSAPRIEHGSDEPLEFTRTHLARSEGSTKRSTKRDPVGTHLLERYPEHRCHRLVSAQPVPFRQTARQKLSVYLGDELMIRALPTPSLQHATGLPVSRGTSRESLYCVVTY